MKKNILTLLFILTLVTWSVKKLYAYYKACTSNSGPIVWTKVGNAGMTGIVGYTIDNNDNLYAASNDGSGFTRSKDHGVTWSALNNGANSGCHWGIGLNDIGEVISGSLHGGGNNPPSCIALDPHEALRLTGNGNTWTSFKPTQCTGFGVPFFPVVVKAVAGISLIAGSSWPPYRSTDHGATWNCPTTPMDHLCGERIGMAISGVDNHTLVLGTGLVGTDPNCQFQWYSTDAGDNWFPLPQVTPWLARCTSSADNGWNVLPNGQLLLAAGTFCFQGNWCYGPQAPPNGSYYFCGNGVNIPWNLAWLAINPADTLVVGTIASPSTLGCGVYQSTDSGVHWAQSNQGLPVTTGQQQGCNWPKFFNILVDSQGFMYLISNTSGPTWNAGDVFRTTNPT